METFFFAVAGYLIGSIPVAYLLAKKKHGIDLRSSGSRNIGARNAYESTKNKRTGFAVLVLDMHKGIIPLVILDKLGYCEAIPVVAVTIIFGHCYPVWLKFHGGRGLATAAAIALLVSPLLLLVWVIVYFLAGIIRANVHLQALIATSASLIFEMAPTSYAHSGGMICAGDHLQVALIVILLIIFSRHIQPVYELLRKA